MQADTISEWPLTLADFTPWALNTVFAPLLPHLIEHALIWIGKSEVGKSPASYTLSHLMSAFWLLQEGRAEDPPSFQTASGRRNKPRVFDDGNLYLETPAAVKAIAEVSGIDRKTMARYNASSYAKNQLCQACSNPYDRTVEPTMRAGASSDTVSFKEFYKLVRPSFHRDFDEEDLLAVFKRSCVVVFTEVGIYIRTPGTSRDPVHSFIHSFTHSFIHSQLSRELTTADSEPAIGTQSPLLVPIAVRPIPRARAQQRHNRLHSPSMQKETATESSRSPARLDQNCMSQKVAYFSISVSWPKKV